MNTSNNTYYQSNGYIIHPFVYHNISKEMIEYSLNSGKGGKGKGKSKGSKKATKAGKMKKKK